jgi:hypothetical protein
MNVMQLNATPKSYMFLISMNSNNDRLYGLVVRVPGYRSRGSVFDFRRYQIFWEVVGREYKWGATWKK